MTLRILYGGTFDPVHNGHLAVALAAANALQSPVAFVPAAAPPHRGRPGATAIQRVRMLKRAIDGYPQFGIDPREFNRTGRSYSVDTLRDVRAELGADAPLVWLLGADALRRLHGWHDWRELLTLAHLVVASRPGHALDVLDPELEAELAPRWISDSGQLRTRPAGFVWQLSLPPQAEAASNVRAQIAAGEPWQPEVPAAVAAYIQENGLYGREKGPE